MAELLLFDKSTLCRDVLKWIYHSFNQCQGKHKSFSPRFSMYTIYTSACLLSAGKDYLKKHFENIYLKVKLMIYVVSP